MVKDRQRKLAARETVRLKIELQVPKYGSVQMPEIFSSNVVPACHKGQKVIEVS